MEVFKIIQRSCDFNIVTIGTNVAEEINPYAKFAQSNIRLEDSHTITCFSTLFVENNLVNDL